MGLTEYAKDDFSIRKTGIEARFSSGEGGHRFWLFLFNIFASLLLFLLLAWFENVVIFVLALFVSIGFVLFFEVDDAWKALTDWRRKK